MAKVHFKDISLEIVPQNRKQNKNIFLSDYEKDTLKFIDQWFSGKDIWPIKTSGSTGNPKNIPLKRDLMRHSANQTIEEMALGRGQTALLSINPNFVGGKMMVVRAIEAQMDLVVQEASASKIDLPTDQTIDFAAFVPMQIYHCLSRPDQKEALNKIKKVLIGGAPLHEEAIKQLQGLDADFYQTYGMTETYSHVALKKLNYPDKEDVFKAVGDNRFSIDDSNRLIIKGTVTDGEDLITNDVVHLIDSRSFNWLGRFDHVINSGGLKFHPEQLERSIQRNCHHLLVNHNYFVSGNPDKKLGEKVTLYVEGEVDQQALYNCLRSSLSKYEVPKEIISVEKFEYTPTGKIDKKASKNKS